MAAQESPCFALRGDGQELLLYADRVVIRNIGLGGVLFGRGERTIDICDIGDVYLYDNTDLDESMIKLTLRHEELPIVLSYPRSMEASAKAIRSILDVHVYHEGKRPA